MLDTRNGIAELFFVTMLLATVAVGQQIERLEPPSGYRWAAWGAPAISPNGEWIALALEGPDGVTIERRCGNDREVFPGRPLLGVTKLRITDGGEVMCNAMPDLDPRSTLWTSSGPVDFHPGSFIDVSNDGGTQVASNGSLGIFAGTAQEYVFSWPFSDSWIHAIAANSDTSATAGESEFLDETGWGTVPLRWDGFVYTVLSRRGHRMGVTYDISSDGAVVTGAVGSWEERFPAIWIRHADPVVIASPGDAGLVTDRGRWVSLTLGDRAAVWTPFAGVRSLSSLGFPTNFAADFSFVSATDDGDRLLAWYRSGEGPDDRGWVLVTLPRPCHVDYASDGVVDLFDLIAFVDCFEGNCPNYRSADFTVDGFVDWMDFAGFVEAFEAGC